MNVLAIIIDLCNELLHKPEFEQELSYLETRVPKNCIDTYKFGAFPKYKNQLVSFMDDLGNRINADPLTTLKDMQLIYINDTNYTVSAFKYHSLIIPWYDVYNVPVAIVGRCLLADDVRKTKKISKYKNSVFDKCSHLFGLNYTYREIIKLDRAIIVEGQFDFYTGLLHEMKNVVAIGNSKVTREQILLLSRYTRNFDIWTDNDEAGDSGYEKIKKESKNFDIVLTRKIYPPGIKDLDELLKNR